MRCAADELRARLAGDTVTFVVNRNINVSNVCIVGLRVLRLRAVKALARRLRALRARSSRSASSEAVEAGATEICIQSGIHPDWGLEDYLGWLRFAKQLAPELHLHAYSPMEVAHMCDVSGLAPRAVFERLRDAGLGRRPGRPPRSCTTASASGSPPTSCRSPGGSRSSRHRTPRGSARPSTVMFGHIEEPWELAEHMRVVRELQERTGGFTEFVPLSFIPFHTLLGRTHGVQEISREENLKHTAAFRLALGTTVTNLQASWVKMGLDAATEALRWGVNDLGGTLMEESISRMAGSYHGVRLEPEQLVAAAHRAGRAAAERTTLYEIRRRYELEAQAA